LQGLQGWEQTICRFRFTPVWNMNKPAFVHRGTTRMTNPLRILRKKIKWWLASPAERRHSLVGPMRDWQKKREFQLLFLKQMGLLPQHYLLDIGCGTLRGGIPLIDYLETGHYFGVEVRRSVLDEAAKELHEAGLEHKTPQLSLAPSLSTLALGREFDFLWAFSVLIHLSDELLEGCLSAAARHLKDTGAFYANVNIGDRQDGQWQGFPVVFRSGEFYREAGRRHGLDVADLGTCGAFHASGIRAQDDKHMLKMCRINACQTPVR
jgi:SAM-dependent methyltransferase